MSASRRFGRGQRREQGKGVRVTDQAFGSLRAALDAVQAQGLATGSPSSFAAFVNVSNPERVVMQFASRGYWLERARSDKYRELLSAVEDDARVFILNASAGEGRSLLLGEALAEESDS